jgi:hypothetical protein
MKVNAQFLLTELKRTIDTEDLSKDELEFARKVENELLNSTELIEIYALLIEKASKFDIITEEIINDSMLYLGKELNSDFELLLSIIKLIIEKAIIDFYYYPYMLMNSVFMHIKRRSFASVNQDFANKMLPELTPLVNSTHEQNNLFALKMADKCLNAKNKHLSSAFEHAVSTNLSEKNWEIRQQTYYVFKKHNLELNNIHRSLWEKLSWPYFSYYRKNKTWL